MTNAVSPYVAFVATTERGWLSNRVCPRIANLIMTTIRPTEHPSMHPCLRHWADRHANGCTYDTDHRQCSALLVSNEALLWTVNGCKWGRELGPRDSIIMDSGALEALCGAQAESPAACTLPPPSWLSSPSSLSQCLQRAVGSTCTAAVCTRKSR